MLSNFHIPVVESMDRASNQGDQISVLHSTPIHSFSNQGDLKNISVVQTVDKIASSCFEPLSQRY